MTATDTNVLLRLLAADDEKQAAIARRVFASGPIWIAKTVLLETAWVLRSLYGYDSASIREALLKVLGLKNVQTENPAEVAAALELAGRGLDFADALHLASRPPGAVFVSFDRSFVRRATRAGAAAVHDPAAP